MKNFEYSYENIERKNGQVCNCLCEDVSFVRKFVIEKIYSTSTTEVPEFEIDENLYKMFGETNQDYNLRAAQAYTIIGIVFVLSCVSVVILIAVLQRK